MLNCAKAEDFPNDKYWSGRYYAYLKDVISEIRELEDVGIGSVLEIGCNGIQLVKGSDTIDICGNPTYKIDAGKERWPIQSKKYDLAICCQVWEHLNGGQQFAFKELQRVSKKAIITVPFMWKSGDEIHKGIAKETINNWYCNDKPVKEKLIGSRLLSVFDFGDK